MTKRRAKHEENLLIGRLATAIETRITHPRGSRIEKYRRLQAAWRRENSESSATQPPFVCPTILYDRIGCTVYGLYWRDNLLKLGRTIWTHPNQAVATFNNYVRRLLQALEEEESNLLPLDLREYIKQKGHCAVKAITNSLRESGLLQVRELATIPMPPDEE